MRDAVASNVCLSIEGLTKRFGGFYALNELSMEVADGSIHALIGPIGIGNFPWRRCRRPRRMSTRVSSGEMLRHRYGLGGERCEDRALHAGGRLRRASEVGELGEDNRELERRRVALGVDLAVARESEERFLENFGFEGGAQREASFPRPVLGREDAVLRRDLDVLDVARLEPSLAAVA